jgi:hypothetical protein
LFPGGGKSQSPCYCIILGELTHNVHSSQLGPDLREQTHHGSVQHPRLEQVNVSSVVEGALQLALLADILQLQSDEGVVSVTFAVNQCQDFMSLLPAVLASQPTGGFREEHHRKEEENGRDHLQTPGNTPGSSTPVVYVLSANESAAVGDTNQVVSN